MGRPHKFRNLSSANPPFDFFVPYGIKEENIGKVFLTEEELEALRIYHYENMKNQILAAQKMNISQATFSRILTRAYDKLTKALIEGLGIGIISHRGRWGWRHGEQHNNYVNMPIINLENQEKNPDFHGFGCLECGYEWIVDDPNQKKGQKVPCPQCKSQNTYFLIKHY